MLALRPRAPSAPSSRSPPENKTGKTLNRRLNGGTCLGTMGKELNPDPQGLLEGRGLVLGVFGDGGVGAGAFAAPHFLGAGRVPVLVGGLRELRPDLHQVLRVGLHQRLGGEQAQVCGGSGRTG